MNVIGRPDGCLRETGLQYLKRERICNPNFLFCSTKSDRARFAEAISNRGLPPTNATHATAKQGREKMRWILPLARR
jgi:hypothetical protein